MVGHSFSVIVFLFAIFWLAGRSLGMLLHEHHTRVRSWVKNYHHSVWLWFTPCLVVLRMGVSLYAAIVYWFIFFFIWEVVLGFLFLDQVFVSSSLFVYVIQSMGVRQHELMYSLTTFQNFHYCSLSFTYLFRHSQSRGEPRDSTDDGSLPLPLCQLSDHSCTLVCSTPFLWCF
jgi:hypothetical protein